jgi:two-component system, cell cycle sensor histidine kinase and response regulator CckA
MEPKTLSRVFETFFTTKEMGRGTGLGLASAYGIVKGHGGYIEVDSRVGLGTTFRIYLPASRKNAAEPVMASGGVHEGSGTLLLVDDEEIVREIGVRLLTTLGYRVLVAEGGREAVEVVTTQGNEIDLVLLDMIMPGMGGSEVFDRVRNIAPRIKILLSSGYSMDGEAKEIMSRGCNGFIQKPYRLDDLSRKLREILSQ